MESKITIESSKTEELEKVLRPSFEGDSEKVDTVIHSSGQEVEIETEAETLGQLRGATDSVFRLSSLAKKIIEE
jgi:tRNA threonylcarbamoyladenosine modification (KEOPS) complex  Pcc1 subunit